MRQSIEDFTCVECGTIDKALLKEETDHAGKFRIRASCSGCGKWLKWYPMNQKVVFERGKHKGKEIKHLHDIGYLEYCLQNNKMCEYKVAMKQQLQRLRNQEI